MFRFVTIAIIMLGQWYLFQRVLKFTAPLPIHRPWHRTAIITLFVIFNLPLVFVYFYIWRLTQMPDHILTLLTPFFIWHMATLFIFIILCISQVIKLPFKIIKKTATVHPKVKDYLETMKTSAQFQQFDSSRRSFLQKGVIGLSAYSFIGATAGVVGKDEYEIIRKTVTIPNLPDVFKGFTIGVMSDIHSSVFMNKDDMSEYVSIMNSLNTDLVVVTGDMVNSQTEEVYPFAEAFSSLKADYGVYGVLGNHDFFTKNVDLVAKEIDGCGVKLLRNDAVKILKENSYLNLVGVDDIGRNTDPNDYLTRALASVKNDLPKILLCHKPYYFENAREMHIDLTLSGHTHGGQVVFGVVDRTPISLAALASKYVAGLYHMGPSQLYVNKGIGSVGVPFRINCPPELTVITLA
jgi:predicted MPP superfamily phosphohydrolase